MSKLLMAGMISLSIVLFLVRMNDAQANALSGQGMSVQITIYPNGGSDGPPS